MIQSPAIWLIPYAQLKATARLAWQAMATDKPTPQIMTVRDWATSLGVVVKAPTDIHFDAGIDRLIAESLIPKALLTKIGSDGLGTAVQRLLDMADEVAPKAAALHPSARLQWANQHAPLFQQGGQFEVEGAIGFIALMWAATSTFDTDVLWQRQAALLASTEHFYTTTGVQPDPLLQAILDGASHKTTQIDLGELDASEQPIQEYTATDSEDLVQQTAALVLQSTGKGSAHKNIALLAIDRQITRRLSAVLANRGVHLVDETGWALSTTTVAAQLMAWLDAMAQDASSDSVLAALKTTSKAAAERYPPEVVTVLEQHIRRQSAVQWAQTGSDLLGDWPAQFSKSRDIAEWLQTTQELLQHVGLWDAMQADKAGAAMCKALWIAPPVGTRMTYKAYVQWVRAVLEASRFRLTWRGESSDCADATVTILPLAQTWGRHFDAVIVPSCDDKHLPARPRVMGDWSTAQREALSLLTSDEAAAQQSKAWAWLCSLPNVSLLWQQTDGAETLQKSSLLQILEMYGRLVACANPSTGSGRTGSAGQTASAGQTEVAEKTLQPDVFTQGVSIDWQTLAPATLSASGYADLRACPYRFYATRILGLQGADELDETVDKRDFGTWLHGTLYRFHESLKHDPEQAREALLDRCALAEQKALRLDDAAFLPFALIWPKTRSAYLAWLAKHEASGARYVGGEVKKEFEITVQSKTVKLIGTLDRIDKDIESGASWLLDYKTEALDKTKKRIKNAEDKNGIEDTQLAFYAALVNGDGHGNEHGDQGQDMPVRAAYVNLAERAKGSQTTQTVELKDIERRTEALLDGIWQDLSSIAAGEGQRATGVLDGGEACTFCQARGLCRRDFV